MKQVKCDLNFEYYRFGITSAEVSLVFAFAYSLRS